MNRFLAWFNYSVALRIGDILSRYETRRQLKAARKIAVLSSEELQQIQNKKLQAILAHAVRTVPAYNKSYLKDLNAELSLDCFPVIDKKNIAGNEEYYMSKEYSIGKCIKMESSGSSGIKSTVYISRKEHSILRATLILWWEWSGYYLGKRMVQTGISPKRGWFKRIKDVLTRTYYIDAFAMTKEEAVRILKKVARKQGVHIGGYASSLYVLAEYAEKHFKDGEVVFDACISWGDKMFAHYKSKIESVFQTKVFENYGCNEGFMIGQKVDLEYFYLYTPNIFLEILDTTGSPVEDGHIGRVVVTKLDGYAMPLIRYDTGDLAVKLPLEEYPKNRQYNFPLLKRVIGRNTDIIHTLDGKALIVHSFTGIFEFYKEIKQFRVVQRDVESITIEFIRSESFTGDILVRIEQDLRERLKTNINIYWSEVDYIEPTKSGKPQIIKNYMIEKSLSDLTN